MEKPSPSWGMGRLFKSSCVGLSRRSAKICVIFTPLGGSTAVSFFLGSAAGAPLGSSALPFGSMGISTLSLPLTVMGPLASSFLGASAGLPLGSVAGALTSGFLGSVAGWPLPSAAGGAGSPFLGSFAGAFPSGFFSSGFLPAGSFGSVGAAALGGGAASLASGFFSPGFSTTVGFLPSAGLGTSACFGSVALPFPSGSLGGALGGGGGGVVGGAGGALGGSLGGSFDFFSAGAAALGACGASGGAGGFCSVDGGVPGAFAVASGFLTSGVGVALFSGIEYLLHVSRNGKCVPNWDALGGWQQSLKRSSSRLGLLPI